MALSGMRMASDPIARRAIVAHCDWSKDPRKRWLASANRTDDTWEIALPEPVGDTSDLLTRLSRRADGGVILGFDFPIGLPVAYGSKTGFRDFRAALGHSVTAIGRLGTTSARMSNRSRAFERSIPRGPAVAPEPSSSTNSACPENISFVSASARRPNGQAPCILFWTLGGNQVGKAAITAWREAWCPT